MKRLFLTLLFASFLLINETTVEWLLAVLVGGYAMQPGFERVMQLFTIDGFLFSGFFRIIPYLLLSAVFIFSNLKQSTLGKTALWCALISISLFHFWGYWEMQHSLFTADHTSSTSALSIIYVPIHAIWISALAGAAGYALAKVATLNFSS